ncbi:MAG: REP-associated tyrosine transposase [Thiotrichales bacterium]
MARPLRIEYAGALYHITSRGDRREAIYHDDEDRVLWLDTFASVCRRFHWRCHAWCLMDNHYHVVVETAEGNLSKGMRQLNGVFTQRSNRRHGRVGHVFQGRYKAILVDADAYLLELARYVVLNPVRAGMVNDTEDWRWSSYLEMVGETAAPEWLATDGLLAHFGADRRRAIAKYKDFVRAGIGLEPVWSSMVFANVLGGEAFVEQVAALYGDNQEGDLSEVSRLQKRPLAKPLKWYKESYDSRDEAMVKAYLSGHYSMKQIGEYFGLHYSTVSKAVKWYEEVEEKGGTH